MQRLRKDILRVLLTRLIVLVAIVFLSAGTFGYWQGWAFVFINNMGNGLIMTYLWKNNPELLRRRLISGHRAEREKAQRTIVFILNYGSIAVLVFSAVEHRMKWHAIPAWTVFSGDILIILGFYILHVVFRANIFASATIEHTANQKVISTGPYSIVRHPMYVGSLLILFGTPLALGSYWGFLASLPTLFLFIWRLTEEENFLKERLQDYAKYQAKTRWRLMPWIF